MSGIPDSIISTRSLELAVVSLESAAQACQSGASLRRKGGMDPLAREYLIAAEQVLLQRTRDGAR